MTPLIDPPPQLGPLLLPLALRFEQLATRAAKGGVSKSAGGVANSTTERSLVDPPPATGADPPPLSWSTSAALESNISELQIAAEALTKENRALRRVHVEIGRG